VKTLDSPKVFSVIIHAAEEGGYWAECPELCGCFTQGETLPETKNNMREAVDLFVDTSADYVLSFEVSYA
jgi:predicted RNase H-like HicB family nuclease